LRANPLDDAAAHAWCTRIVKDALKVRRCHPQAYAGQSLGKPPEYNTTFCAGTTDVAERARTEDTHDRGSFRKIAIRMRELAGLQARL
jgi:hypothetical protein